MADIL